MPGGIPVATGAIGGARNAGLLAARILGTWDLAVREQMATFQADLANTVRSKDRTVQERFNQE
jgi:5-(carboxyamino)imidazole ribonucleotide mutase